MADRVAALEAKVGSKSIEEQFREQAELIDRLFAYRFEENDKKWDAKLDQRFGELDLRFGDLDLRFGDLELRFGDLELKFGALERKLDEKLEPIKTDLAALTDAVKLILMRLP